MLSFHIPDGAKKLWDEWNLRSAVLLSLSFQVALVCSANSRKRSGRWLLTAFVWSFYLLADWIAAFAVGLISSGQANDCPDKQAVSKEVAAFWAPFLLLHLGGPDVITAFSLEDNELWIRHLLGLVFQFLAVLYVFTQSLPNRFWIPTLLMIFAGTCKYAERTRALYRACLGNFKSSLLPQPDSGPNYAQLMEEYSAMEASQVPVRIDIVKEPEKGSAEGMSSGGSRRISEMEIVRSGYKYYKIFRGLVVDHMFSFHERNESRAFFSEINHVDAFKVLEVELNFMYDALYTKMEVVHCKIGYLLRLLCTALILTASRLHQKSIRLVDKVVTYVLLIGAVGLDLVAFFNLVFSDWTIVSAKEFVSKVLIKLWCGKRCGRWCYTIYRHSFIRFCLKKRWFRLVDKMADFFGIKENLEEFQYKERTHCEEKLKEFIFEELKAKAADSKTIKDAKEKYSARGDSVLSGYLLEDSYSSISYTVSKEVEYDESLILWHVATELCYFRSSLKDPKSSVKDPKSSEKDPKSSGKYPNRKFCKVISDYMLYLLVMRPTLMSAVAGIAQIRFQDTFEEAKKIFQRGKTEGDRPYEEACKKLLEVKTVVKPKEVKGDRSKSLLFDACILANDLNGLGEKKGEDKKWEMMSKVWVELLSYAASHCRPSGHAQLLSKGGELITFVWLQMAHFGLGEQFRIEAGHTRAKLLTGKQVKKHAREPADDVL